MLNMAKPTIGIRPIIDGRWGGVRESLEGKTMAMAQAAKALIEANVFYTDGTPVECVVSPLYNRRRRRGGKVRGVLRNAECMRNALRHSLLVLRQ